MKRLILGYLLILLTACGGANPEPNPTDKIAPTLSSSLPAKGASAVPINAKLGFSFNEAMDEESLELTSNPAITLGTPTWNAASTSIVFDNGNLAASTAYTLSVKAKDVSGNALAETTITFTTSDSADTTAPSTPTGLVATPANGQVTLTWQANPEADIAGYTVYVGTAQDKLESKDFVTTNSKAVTGLTNGTTYFFAIDAVDAANNHSSQSTPVSATPSATITDSTPPTIQSSDPADGATGVNPRDPNITLVFSEPMNTAEFAFTIVPPFRASDASPDEQFELTWSNNDTTLTIKPSVSELLPETTLFTLTLTSAKDKAGNVLSGDKEISFTTTEDAPRIVLSSPEKGASNVQVEPFEIKLSFSKPMDTSTFKVVPTLEPVDIPNYSQGWVLTWNTDDTELTITTTVPLPGYFLEDSIYTLALGGKSKAGLGLIDTNFSFKTVIDSSRPTIVKTSPIDGTTDRPLSPLDVFIYFDDLMDQAATLAAISSSPELPCIWQHFFFTDSANDKDLGSAFACRSTSESFEASTTYTISISTDAIDTSGNKLSFGTCIADPNDPPCAYTFSFTTLTPPPPTGTLQLDISGLPSGENKVRVTGPNDFDSGLLDASTPFNGLPTGDYTVTATGFVLAPGKPACRIYTPTPDTQVVTVSTNATATATVTYETFSCDF